MISWLKNSSTVASAEGVDAAKPPILGLTIFMNLGKILIYTKAQIPYPNK